MSRWHQCVNGSLISEIREIRGLSYSVNKFVESVGGILVALVLGLRCRLRRRAAQSLRVTQAQHLLLIQQTAERVLLGSQTHFLS